MNGTRGAVATGATGSEGGTRDGRAASLSLRGRLLAATLAATVIVALLAGWVLSTMFRDEVTRQHREALTRQLDELTARFELDAQGAPTLDASTLGDPRWRAPYSGLYWQVDELTAGGLRRAVLRSRSLWEGQLEAPTDGLADGQIHAHELRGPEGTPLLAVERTVRLDAAAPSRWRLVVAADRSGTAAAVGSFDRVLGLSLAVLVALLAVAAAAQVAIGLRPLQDLQRALAEVHAGRMQRLEGRFPREVQPLVDDFNAVLAGHAEVVERARTQAGNLAHAVKTPLAAMAQAAAAARSRPQALGELPALVTEQVALARRQVDWQLSRARAAAALSVPGMRAPVAPTAAGLVRVLERVYAERGLRLDVAPIAPALAFAGEAQDLQEMLGNLLDNACKWARSRVTIAAMTEEGTDGAARLRLVVEDDGPGIAVEQRDRVLARGERLDESSPGSGLGLAIVRDLARLYGGTIMLDEAIGGGLRATLALPAAAS